MSCEIVNTTIWPTRCIKPSLNWNNCKWNNRRLRASLVESLLFGSAITNDTNIIFITCDRLSDAKYPLIDEKLHKTIGAIKLAPTKNWNLLKRE